MTIKKQSLLAGKPGKGECVPTDPSQIKAVFDGLTDEVVTQPNGGELLVHHIDGNPKNKLVVGTSRKGKSFLGS